MLLSIPTSYLQGKAHQTNPHTASYTICFRFSILTTRGNLSVKHDTFEALERLAPVEIDPLPMPVLALDEN